MVKHDRFYRGVFFALAGGLALDFLFVHQLANHHHLYNHPSVNIVEPVLAIILIIIAVILFRKEYKG